MVRAAVASAQLLSLLSLLLLMLSPAARVVLADPACLCKHPDQGVPVCGSDGGTYPSRCVLECASARPTAGLQPLSLAHEGPCQSGLGLGLGLGGAAGAKVSVREARAVRTWDSDLANCLGLDCATHFGQCGAKCGVNDDNCYADCALAWARCTCDCKKYLPSTAASASSSSSSSSASSWAAQPASPAMTSLVSTGTLVPSSMLSRKSLQEMSECLTAASTNEKACIMKCGVSDEACRLSCYKAELDTICRCSAATVRQAVLVVMLAVAARWLLPAL